MISYKKQYYGGHLLSEGAILAEVAQLVASKLDNTEYFQCERMYKDFVSNITDQTRIDIVICKSSKKLMKKKVESDSLLYAIEIKRYEKNWTKIQQDFEKMWRLKKHLPNVRLFQIVFGQGKLPTKLFTKNHNVFRKNIYTGKGNFCAFPRVGKKSYNTKKPSQIGNYAVLIELEKHDPATT